MPLSRAASSAVAELRRRFPLDHRQHRGKALRADHRWVEAVTLDEARRPNVGRKIVVADPGYTIRLRATDRRFRQSFLTGSAPDGGDQW